MGKSYVTDSGRVVRVEQSFDGRYGTFSRRPSGSLERFKSPSLPMRDDLLQAVRDLAAHAEHRGWRQVEEG